MAALCGAVVAWGSVLSMRTVNSSFPRGAQNCHLLHTCAFASSILEVSYHNGHLSAGQCQSILDSQSCCWASWSDAQSQVGHPSSGEGPAATAAAAWQTPPPLFRMGALCTLALHAPSRHPQRRELPRRAMLTSHR